ncbi:acetyl esterase/lipase [Catenuloplanes nepalensis]|uniref:Acetyl esterase/lipase n=1 Tax=Catenuloplanes nepalensis TaxID=587533 RepID=A0ABT9MWZ9_9ACTN|nr:alpha/beta hydrolase [Catenuloplanes nepalensis]MDP9795915.1 acetyl esterase/lipase [Catenuloplanes nepalensis]
MPYAYDPELAAVVPQLASPDLRDIPAVRAAAPAPTPGDYTGLTVTEVDLSSWSSLRSSGSSPLPAEAAPRGVRLRLYRPDAPAAPAAILAVHGGGFVLGSIDGNDARNAAFARDLGVLVASVDYRLAPEHPYPAALDDCYAALTWLAGHASELGIDPARIALHGASAGGGLCAGLALLARDRGGPAIAFQYLGIPVVDDRMTTPSMTAFTDTPNWDRASAEISWNAYLGEGVPGGADVPVYAAPARATDLTGLPPAYVSVMHFDPLRDEGIAYALALLAAGVPVELHLFPGTFHGSTRIPSEISRREEAEATAVLRAALLSPAASRSPS